MLRGLDVSHWNNYNSIAPIVRDARCDFLIAKMSEGGSYTDPLLTSWQILAREEHKLFGVYHFLKEDVDFQIQWNHLYSCIKNLNASGILVAIDWEASDLSLRGFNILVDLVNACLNTFGKAPLVYMSASTLDRFHESAEMESKWNTIITNCGLWLAKWTVSETCFDGMTDIATFPHPGVCAIRQVSSRFCYEGKHFALDSDIAYMTKDAWKKYALK